MGVLSWLRGMLRQRKRVRLREVIARGEVVSSLVANIPADMMAATELLRVLEYIRGLPVDVHHKVLVFTSWAREVGYQPTSADYASLRGRWR